MTLAAMLLAPRAAGAPIVPDHVRLPDTVRSLTSVDRVRVTVTTDGDHPEAIGLSAEKIRTMLVRRLNEVHLPVAMSDDDTAPMLNVVTVVLTEPRVEGAVAYDLRVSLDQQVRVRHVHEPLLVPTYFITYNGLEHHEVAVKVAPRHLEMLVGRFLLEHQQARGGTAR
ncbi:MAG: hypothetical protein CMJ18_19910 [Phycisphaeraceae bacterium]|nr:hypothetical protein [Phycisphaeraceae bacterium]